jgi:tyrosinase
MASYIRANAWNNGGTFDNKDLYWYAIGVRAMMARALNDSSSWWFFAAIHGEYVTKDPRKFPGWGYIPGVPKVPITPLPEDEVIKTYWNQCQHQSWFFAPWHRGYLFALEAQLREDIVGQKGPATWALPYWNYFGPGDEFDIPPVFTQQKMPDDSPNPLFVTARYGPYGNGVVFNPTASALQKHTPVPHDFTGMVTEKCLSNTIYTGSNIQTPHPGFGGPKTDFWHVGGMSGNLENDPHNLTHVYVGGTPKPNSDGLSGLMTRLGLAALDPIFYLHHANIDRMWAAWNSKGPHIYPPPESGWWKGPEENGGRRFIMPMPGKKSWSYTPQDVDRLSRMDYTYENLEQIPVVDLRTQRLSRLGVTVPASAAASEPVRNAVELVGANDAPVSIKGSGASTTVQLDTEVWEKVTQSLAMAAETLTPDRVYLNLENVRGTEEATALSIFINLPEGSNPNDHLELLAGTVGLFGLREASLVDGRHLGGGLSFLLDVSSIVDRMHLDGALNTNALRVTILPNRPLPDGVEILVGQVSVYREGL